MLHEQVWLWNLVSGCKPLTQWLTMTHKQAFLFPRYRYYGEIKLESKLFNVFLQEFKAASGFHRQP